jgi:hypothetical protein
MRIFFKNWLSPKTADRPVQLAAEPAAGQRVSRRCEQLLEPWRHLVLSVAVLLIIIVAVIGTGVMTGIITMLFSKIRRLEETEPRGDSRLPAESFDKLAAELTAVRDQLDMLEQRTEFNERLLEGRTPDDQPTVTDE